LPSRAYPMTNDRAEAVAALIREWPPEADPDALLCAIISKWPDLSDAELQQGIDLAAEQRALLEADPA
jgi:hypothetical protein